MLIDSRVADLSILRDAARPLSRVVIVERHQDGLATIVQHLATATTPFRSLHLIGHGGPGQLWLGRVPIDAAALEAQRTQLASSTTGLAADATVAIYACEFARSAWGLDAVAQVGRIFRRPVFAASRRVGAPRAGGDWSLDLRWDRTGISMLSLRAAIAPITQAFALDRLARFSHSFAPPNLLYGSSANGEIFTIDLGPVIK